MEFSISPEIFEKHPLYCIGGVIATGVNNTGAGEKSYQLLQKAAEQARLKVGSGSISGLPSVAVWRDAFRLSGIKPGEFPSSIEALLKRVVRGDSLPDINPAVNLSNTVALSYLLPMGGHDLDQLVGNLEVRTARDGDIFSQPEGRPGEEGRVESVTTGEPVYCDQAEVRTRRWVWRQGRKARVTSSSTSIFFPIDGFYGLNEGEVKRAAEELASLLTEHTGASCRIFFVDKNHPLLSWGLPRKSAVHPLGQNQINYSKTKGPQPEVEVIPNSQVNPDEIDRLLIRAVAEIVTKEELEAKLRSGRKLRIKLGIDPTGPLIHIGRSVTLHKLRAFQDLGHQVVLIIGDFTATIGDASDKESTRPILTRTQVEQNLQNYKDQMGLILKTDEVEWHYNSEWFGQMSFEYLMTELMPRFTVAQMIERENFRERFRAGKPVSLQEIMYPIMQAYDSVMIKADVELGGTDQLFNMMTGRQLQEMFGQAPQSILMTNMINGRDGRKMSTSEGNGIYIKEEPRNQYGQVMSTIDELIIPYFQSITRVPEEEIEQIKADLGRGENPVNFKRKLAYTLVEMYHGKEAAEDAAEYFKRTVSEHQLPDDMPEFSFPSSEMQLRELLVEVKLAESKAAAERFISGGGISINGEKATEPKSRVKLEDGLVLRRGRHYARVRVKN